MKKTTILFIVSFQLFAWHSQAQISPVEVTGFTEDIVANGVGTMDSSTTDIADDDSFCLVSEDWKLNSTDPPISVGLPEDGIIVSTSVTGLTYQIPTAAAPYDSNNSLRIDESGSTNAGTLELVNPASYTTFYLLVFSGSGESDVDVTINFGDATSETFSNNLVPDWFLTGLPVEIQGFGRGDITNDNVESPLNNPKLFRLELDISVANQAKSVESITVTRNNPSIDIAVFNLIAVSGVKIGCPPPSNLSIGDVTQTSATLSWDAVSPAVNGYEWFVFNSGDNPSTGTPVATGTTSMGTTTADVSALVPATFYDSYVISNCDADGMSDLSEPVSFQTSIPPPGCGGKFYDTGGANGEFTDNEDYTTIVSPDAAGNVVTAAFTFVNNSAFDILTVDIGDGNPVVVPEIDPGAGDPPVSYTSIASDGSLIFHFVSTGAVTNPGWEADITCTLGIKEVIFDAFSYTPNPVKNELILMLKNGNEIQKISIYDLLGKEVLGAVPHEHTSALDMSDLSPGIYLMKITINGLNETFKLIKE